MAPKDTASLWPVDRRAVVKLCALLLLSPGQLWAASPDAGAKPVASLVSGVYRGRLGEHDIQLELALEQGVEDSVEGSYFVFGEGAKILLAGEFEGSHLTMEESHNGKDVSGTWMGEISASGIAGLWHDASESKELSFQLTRIPGSKSGKP
ncbi:MAG: hypothetical protein ABSF50_01480 [Burkholderiaceae bacterium]|jgi:hypothetical protein